MFLLNVVLRTNSRWGRHLSPVFDDVDRERLADSGFELVGIRKMARQVRFDPGPRVENTK